MAAGFFSTEDKSSSIWQFAQFWVMVLISFGFLCLQSIELCAGTPFTSLNHTRSLWYPIQTQYKTVIVFSCELRHLMSLKKTLKNSTISPVFHILPGYDTHPFLFPWHDTLRLLLLDKKKVTDTAGCTFYHKSFSKWK